MNRCFDAKIYSCLLLLCLGGKAFAKNPNEGYGRVSMLGSIIETPCAISTADLYQTINMGISTIGEIVHRGEGSKRKFSLNLINCDLQSKNMYMLKGSRFEMTFDGPSENGIFGVTGADGVGLEISDSEGNVAIPGKPLPAGLLTDASLRLEYTLRLIGNHQQLRAGDYQTILRFKVDYF